MNELVKAQLEAVGFKVKLEVMDWNALLDVAIKGREKYPQYNAINISRATQDPVNGLLRFVISSSGPRAAATGAGTSTRKPRTWSPRPCAASTTRCATSP